MEGESDFPSPTLVLIIPPYAYSAPNDTWARDTYAQERGSKRRRLDAGDGSDAAETYHWQQPQFLGHQNGSLYAESAENAATGGLDEVSDAASSWQQHIDPYSATLGANGASASSPEVTSYQQPYFNQQTDPLTYNSPWPPQATQPYAPHASYSTVQQPGVVPVFPQTTHALEQSYDTSSNAPQSYQELEPNPIWDYAQSNVATQHHQNHQSRRASAFSFEDASMHLKLQSLSILDSLAVQLIHTLSESSFQQIQDLMSGSDAEDSQAYMTVKNLFNQTRKVYSRDTPFIDAIAIQLFQPHQQEIVRKANIATFISSVLGAHDLSFFDLNEFFMKTFVPLGHRLLKWQGSVFLELKTQVYISALINSDGSAEAILDELFPTDLDAQILTRHPDTQSLSPSELDFVERSKARKSYLLAEPSLEEALQELPKKYQWGDFIRGFVLCISKNIDGIMDVPAVRTQAVLGGSSAAERSLVANRQKAAQDAVSGQQKALVSHQQIRPIANNQTSLNTSSSQTATTTADLLQTSNNDAKKGSTSASSTIRQPWTPPEEEALLSGLERVHGPHWSQILALYGRGGSVSEILRDRNQVQLKDKARNLKLWYLKTGRAVPVSLRGVTGELKKRGGARARAMLLGEGAEIGELDPELEGTEVRGKGAEAKLGGKKKAWKRAAG